MNEREKYRSKKASQKEIHLYTLLGESLYAVQILEDALSHAIVLKKTEPDQKKEADVLLEKHRSSYTFGKALSIAKKESLLPKPLENELSEFLKERNWLIHKSITDNKKDYRTDFFYKSLSEKTKAIALKANTLRISIELDLIEYTEKKGIDMTKVKNFMNEHYGI